MGLRLDIELVRRGTFPSRAKAQEAIRSGIVRVDGTVCDRPGRRVSDGSDICVVGRALPFVSRGGLKLEAALEAFRVPLEGVTLLDVGSSTGGFTDCALRRGAARVIAVDVGTNQMAAALRDDPRVSLHEQTDFRTMEDAELALAEVATVDVAFVSATLMVGRLARLEGLQKVICLVKPQFECGHAAARAHHGIIRDEGLRQEAVSRVRAAFAEAGFSCEGVMESPVAGGDGNVEFLAYFVRERRGDGRCQGDHDALAGGTDEATPC